MTRASLLTATILAILVVLGGTAVVAADSFTDVEESNVFADDISWLAEKGITRGCNPPANTEFCPEAGVSREQMAAFLHRTSSAVLEEAVVGGNSDLEAKLAAANLATAAFQDVAVAEDAGYVSTLGPGDGSLGCFENPSEGGMGVHYLKAGLLDDTVDARAPEALVYELDNEGNIAGLVAHEYIVPVDAWTEAHPPMLFGRHFHQHPVLPLYVLHAWIWKDNPSGMFNDWNPTVRLCPDGVPVFGQ